MPNTISKDLGIVTAYGYAVSKGYTGSEDDFATLMASYATVAQQAADSAAAASDSADAAAASATAAAAAMLNAYPHAVTGSGEIVFISDGAENVAVRSVSADMTGVIYAAEPRAFLANATPTTVSDYVAAKPRCIVFPCSPLTTYTVSKGASTTMRIASFADYPSVGSTSSNYQQTVGTTISITTGGSDAWILCQLFIDNENPTFDDCVSDMTISPAPAWAKLRIHRVGQNVSPAASISSMWNSDGTSVTSGGTRTAFFRVKGGEKYVWAVKNAATARTYMVWFDENMNLLGTSAERRLDSGNTSATLTAPAGSVWASISCRTVQEQTWFIRGEEAAPYSAYSESTAMLDLSDGTLDEDLTTRLGANDFYADAGSITVDYRADITMYINAKIPAQA